MDKRDELNAFYDRALAEGEGDASRVGWDSEAGQPLRFEALLQVVAPQDLTPTTRLLDVGCGLGDLVAYLKATGRQVDYTGIDINPNMIAEARRRHPGARFKVADVFELEERFDVVLCAGALGVRFGTEEDNWRFVRQLQDLAELAVAFNLLVHDVALATHELSTRYWQLDPADIAGAISRLAPRYTLRGDVLPSDVIVYLYGRYAPILRGPYPGAVPRAHLADAHLHWSEPEDALAALAAGDPPTSPRDRAEEAFLRGFALCQADQMADALAAMEEGLALHPSSVHGGAGLLRMLISERRLDEARQALERLLEAEGVAPSQRDWLRQTVHSAQLVARDVSGARQVEAGAETDHGRCLMVGARLLAEGELDAAESTLTSALLLRPDDERPTILLGKVHLRAERYPLALKAAARVLDRFPKQPDARGIGLMALQRLGHLPPDQRQALLGPLLSHKVLGPLVARMLR